MRALRNPLVLGLAVWALIIVVGTISIAVIDAGSTKTTAAVTINQNWGRADARGEFYSFEFLNKHFNPAVTDIDTLFAKLGGVVTDSLYKLRMKAQRAWVDTVKTAVVYFPGQVAVDTLPVRTVALKGVNSTGVINSDSLQLGSGTLITKLYTTADSLHVIVAGGDTLAWKVDVHLGPH